MIVVVGHPLAMAGPDGRRPAGAAALAALAAARAGAQVQLVGKVGDDDVGDEVVLALAAAGVGHVALLRDASCSTPLLAERALAEDVAVEAAGEPGPSAPEPTSADRRPTLEAADVELGLRYLTDFRAVVLAEPLSDAVVRVAAEAAGYAEAELIVVTDDPATLRVPLPASSLVLASAGDDPDGSFASLLGAVAAAVDAGASAADALAEAARRLGATRPD